MAQKTAFLEKAALNSWLRASTLAVSGSNASTTNVLTAAGATAGFNVGDVVQLSTPGSLHRVTAVPDNTHVTISPAAAVAPTTGNVVRVAYAPTAVYVGLFTAAPSDAGGGTEATGGSYARVQITQADGSWAAPSGTPSSTSNSGVVTFPTSTASWGGTMTHFGIFDALTTGNLLAWNTLTTPQAVGATGITPSIAIGALVWQED